MSAKSDILFSIRARKVAAVPAPAAYRPEARIDDSPATFAERAKFAHSEIHELESMADVPGAIADLLRAKNLAARIHMPPDPALEAIAWGDALSIERTAPGPDDAAVALAPYAIAETGTLVYPARDESPASWHFRAGLEIAILPASAIAAHLEDVLAKLKAAGALAHTINLVTGPSRTGDIEQTLELGAHGPKSLAILIVKDA